MLGFGKCNAFWSILAFERILKLIIKQFGGCELL